MKLRMASKAIDFKKVRWDARRNKFVPLEGGTTKSAPVAPSVSAQPVNRGCAAGAGTLTKDNAEAVARLNGVWKPEYEKLRGTGRIVMTVGNVLKGLVKKGGEVKWN